MIRLFLLSFLCFLPGVFSVAAATAPAGASHPKPNIIFVVADDMGFKDTGYSGNPIAKTPHLDRMAAEGLRFDNFYSAAGTCSPGRMAILTGRTPLRARMTTTVGPMQEGEVTVAAALKTAGYETGHFGKWGLGRNGTHPLKVGFDEADIVADPGQERNIADQHPEKVQRMLKELAAWRESVKTSFAGKDYLR